jgi:hypothetical protein
MNHSKNDLRVLWILRANMPGHKIELMESTHGVCWRATVVKFDPPLKQTEGHSARMHLRDLMREINHDGVAMPVHTVDFV